MQRRRPCRVALGALAILAAGLAPASADLGSDPAAEFLFTRLTIDPVEPVVEDRVFLVVEALNGGTASLAQGDATIRILVDGEEVRSKRNPEPIPPGYPMTTNTVWRARSPGTVEVKVVLEVGGVVAGTFEQRLMVHDASLPDLQVSSIRWAPLPSEPGQVQLHAGVGNHGGRNADLFRVRFIVDGRALRGDPVPSSLPEGRYVGDDYYLPRGGVASAPGPYWMWDGQPHTIRVEADVTDVVAESNEDNNFLEVSFPDGEILRGRPPLPRPDLAVVEMQLNPDPPTVGVPTHVLSVVRNLGTVVTGGVFELVIDEAAVLRADFSDLLPLESRAFSATWVPSEGPHAVEARVLPWDPRDADRANDRFQRDVVVHPVSTAAREPARPGTPDLAVIGIQPPGNEQAEGRAVLTARVANLGTAPSGPLEVSFVVDGTVVAVVELLGLSPGQEETVVTRAWAATPGVHVLEVRAASTDRQRESSTTNNQMFAGMKVAGTSVTPATLAPIGPLSDHATVATGATLLAGFVALYHRIHGHDALSSPTRRRVYEHIRADPGCTVGGVARMTSLSYKTVQRHVRTLVRAGLVGTISGGQRHLFAVGSLPARDHSVAVVLRTPSARRVWTRLLQGPAGLRELAREIGLSPATVAEQARRLESNGLVTRTSDGKFVVLRGPSP